MSYSSRRCTLLVVAVLVLGTGAYSLGWLGNVLPIEVGQTETGEIANGEPESSEPGLLGLQQTEPAQPMTDVSHEASESRLLFSSQSEPQVDQPQRSSLRRRGNESQPVAETTQPLFGARPAAELPNEFPSVESTAESGSIRRPRTARTTERRVAAQETIQPAGFQMPAFEREGSPANEPRDAQSGRRGFESAEPRTLADSQRFPSTRIALLDRTQTAEPFGAQEPQSESAPASFAPAVAETEFIAPRSEPKPARLAARSDAVAAGKIDLEKIDRLMTSGDVVTAQRELSGVYWNQPELRPAIMERLDRNAQAIYFVAQTHFVEPYVVQSGDKLQNIATKYQVSWPYLAQLNKVDPKKIRVGQKLKVIKGPFSVFVDLSDFELTVHAHGFFVKRYQVGVGKDGSSPIGKFTVLDKIEKAQYTDPKGKVIAGGAPNNPLGTHWIDLGKSYGIHGTIEPDSIGKAESRGCVRMRNEDVNEVYNFLVKGSEVVIRQ